MVRIMSTSVAINEVARKSEDEQSWLGDFR